MADRTVKVKLVADVSDYTAGLLRAAQQTRSLGDTVERDFTRTAGPKLSKAGEAQGGILAKGIHSGLIRHSPLIAAAIGAALAAGAPVMLASAGVLFGGVGALAAAQTDEVREAWTDLGHDIRDSAVQDASVLVPVYVGMADKIGAAFQRMRPELRDAFEAAGPQIDRFTDGLTNAAENALPGLLRAVERGGPVIDGLATLMEDVGTGLSDFFDAMSDNSEASGDALAALGDVLAQALPLLGELLGAGSEIAATVLPALADALGAVNAVARALGPALPAIATGFIALKVAGGVAGGITALTASLGAFSGAATKGAASAGLLGRALPMVGLAMAGIAIQQSENTGRVDRYTEALLKGGEAAAKVRREVQEQADSGVWERLWQAFTPGDEHDIEGDFAKAEEAVRGLAGSEDTLAASVERTTAAMNARAAMAAAAANSDLAYRMSVDATETAVSELAAAIATNGAASEEAADAALQVEQAMLQQAQAARQSAFDTSTATSEAQKNAEADAAMLAELLQLRSVMGSSFPAALNTTISRLQSSTNAGMVAAAQFNQLGLNVLSVPNSKTITVSSTTPQQIALLESLGFKVRTLPDGTVEVTAHTAAAEAAINQAARNRTATITVRTVNVNQQAGRTYYGQVPAAAEGGAIMDGRLVQHFDGGGAVRGAGGPKTDSIPARLSNGEHVWTAAEVLAAGGQAAVAEMRRAVLSGRETSASAGRIVVQTTAAPAGPSGPLVSVGTMVVPDSQTPHETAEALRFLARTRG